MGAGLQYTRMLVKGRCLSGIKWREFLAVFLHFPTLVWLYLMSDVIYPVGCVSDIISKECIRDQGMELTFSIRFFRHASFDITSWQALRAFPRESQRTFPYRIGTEPRAKLRIRSYYNFSEATPFPTTMDLPRGVFPTLLLQIARIELQLSSPDEFGKPLTVEVLD